MKKHNVLVVDDDPEILELIALYLTNAGYKVYTTSNCANTLKILHKVDFHMIILDIMLPDVLGTTLCQYIRQITYCPIIFISCNDDEESIIKALQVGGDDYIRKPLNFKELLARVKSNLRRVWYNNSENPISSNILVVKDLRIDIEEHTVFNKHKRLYLSPIEFDILIFMIKNSQRILSYSEIYEHVWKYESLGDTRTVMVHVSNLRKKLQGSGDIQYIKTIKKIGYMFTDIN